MLLERFDVPGLAHYSYAVGCTAAREVAIVDPERVVDRYLAWARRSGVRITRVLETHVHADYASGARELALRTGAELHLSKYDEGELYEIAFPHDELSDGEVLEVGSVRLVARHTPGHTPEHLSYIVFDTMTSAELPCGLLSGDFLFVGSLGRPDLLGEESQRRLASQLYASSRECLEDLPDDVQIYPAHGAGSMCGSGMAGLPSSTMGLERRTNPYLDPALDERTFVERILESVPPFPPYYRRMKRVNAEGAPLLGDLSEPGPLTPEEVERRLEEGSVAIDVRDAEAFGAAHVPGSFGIGLGPGLATWAAWVVPYETPLVLVLPEPGEGEEAADLAAAARRWLVRVGLDRVEGWLEGGIEAWTDAGGELRGLPQLDPEEVNRRLDAGEIRVLDVRSDEEWAAGHVRGAVHIMGGHLAERVPEVPDGASPLAVVCGSGYRSTVAASVLERAGREGLLNVRGGMTAWERAGLPLERE